MEFDHLDNKLVILSFIAVSHLRPDIVFYYIATETVILLELACPCKENMDVWHNKKFEKYYPLSLAMVSNGWSVHLFPLEKGTRVYCSANVKSSLMRLGFSTSLVRSILN